MSQRNTLENKYTRTATRVFGKSVRGTQPVGRVPQEISARILSNPKQMRLSGKSRRRLQRLRGLGVVAHTPAPKNFAVKAAVKLTTLTLAQLLRRQIQTARRASTCKHIIAKLSPGSMFAISIKSQQTHELSLLKQISAEIQSRNHQSK